MSPSELQALADAYVEHYSNPHEWDEEMVLRKRDNRGTEWAIDAVMDLAFEDPDALWWLILEILRRNPPIEVIEVLAAGPLEDYLAKCGEAAIDRVEKQAQRDPRFRSLLGGVWQNGMSDAVWARVQASWDRSGWDGGA
jgi:hypothetical protein